jgi:hypothetical protein
LDLRLFDKDGICKANYKVIEELLSSCQSLQKLSLAKLTLNFEMIKNLCLQNGSTLQTLDLSYCKGLTFDCIEWIITNCLELKELNLNSTELTEDTVNFLTNHLTPGITKLNLAGFEFINDEDILSLVSRCNQLSALDL